MSENKESLVDAQMDGVQPNYYERNSSGQSDAVDIVVEHEQVCKLHMYKDVPCFYRPEIFKGEIILQSDET